MFSAKAAKKMTKRRIEFNKNLKEFYNNIEREIKSAAARGRNCAYIDKSWEYLSNSEEVTELIIQHFSKMGFIVEDRPGYYTRDIKW